MAITLYGSKQAIIQVVQTVKTNVFTTTSSSYVDITGYSVSITPSSASNKILVMADLKASNLSSNWTGLVLVRDSTQLYLGVEGGYTGYSSTAYTGSYIDGVWQNTSLQFLDSPATTSAVTYKVQIRAIGGTAVVGRLQHNPNSVCVPSSITVMEVAYA